jgi:hypothetical protein
MLPENEHKTASNPIIEVRHLKHGEWELYRSIRLEALQNAPYAFGSNYEREIAFTEEKWKDCAESRATGKESICVIAIDVRRGVGIAGGITPEDNPRVNLLFDHETDAIKVESRYTHNALTITLKEPGPLWVRIPSWIDGEALVASVPGSRMTNGYLFVASHPIEEKLELAYDLPTLDLTLSHRSRDIRVRMRGDSVEAMDNFGADLTFFPALS